VAEKHPQKARKELNTKLVYLEFFFDGQLAEISEDPAVFERAFENMIDSQLQARRMTEFRKKLGTRKRTGGMHKSTEAGVEDAEGGGSASSCLEDDGEWRSYLQKPVQPTELTIRAMREAGCMIRFLVCQSSLSVSASEELGQIAFQEHFPVDGKEQEIIVSTKPLPRWVYYVGAFAAVFTLLTLYIFVHVFKDVFTGPPRQLPP